jgi:hypothetical protein
LDAFEKKLRKNGFSSISAPTPGLPDGVRFQTKNTNLGKFWRASEFEKVGLCISMAIWRPFGIFYGPLVI